MRKVASVTLQPHGKCTYIFIYHGACSFAEIGMDWCTQKIVDAGAYTIDKETKIGTYELSNGSSGSEEVSAESESVSASQVKARLEKKLAALSRRVTRLEAQLEGRGGAARVST